MPDHDFTREELAEWRRNADLRVGSILITTEVLKRLIAMAERALPDPEVDCPECGGSGVIPLLDNERCDECSGRGFMSRAAAQALRKAKR